MSDELAVVRRPYVPGLKPIRTGVVLAQHGDLYEVRWDDDGSEDEIRLGDYERVMPRGSLSYLAALGGLDAAFAADALPVVLRVLSESGGPVNAKAIRAYLVVDLGLDKTVWSATWPKLQKTMLAHEGVVCAGEGAARAFSWTGDKLPDLPAEAVEPAAEPVEAALPEEEPTSTPPADEAPATDLSTSSQA